MKENIRIILLQLNIGHKSNISVSRNSTDNNKSVLCSIMSGILLKPLSSKGQVKQEGVH